MKKEVTIAITIGFTIGLIITFGIYRAQKAYQDNKQSLQNNNQQQQTNPTEPPPHSLVVTSPVDETLSDQDTVTITGTTSPNSYLTAVSSQHQTFTQAQADGTFSLEMTLEEGANIITITSLDQFSNSQTADLTITYSTADLEPTENVEEDTEEGTDDQ